jgi:O-antigen/teichoic acid export membrane protein
MKADIARSVVALTIKILAALSVLLLNAVITRVLDLNEAGQFLNINALVLLLIVLGSMGLPQVIVRQAAELAIQQRFRELKKNIYEALILALCMGLISVAVVIVGASALRIQSLTFQFFPIMIAWVLCAIALRVAGGAYRGLGFTQLANLLTGVNSHGPAVTILISSALVALAMIGKIGLYDIGLVYVGVLVIMLIPIFFFLLKFLSQKISIKHSDSLVSDKKNQGRIAGVGATIFLTELSLYLITQGDIWVVSYWGGNESGAVYGMAAKVAIVTSLFLAAANSVIHPWVAKFKLENNMIAMENRIRALNIFSTLPALLWVICCVIWGGDILAVGFGKEYADGYSYLIILSIGQLIGVMMGPCALLLFMMGKERAMMWTSLIVLLAYMPGVFYFGKHYGVYGVAWGTAAAFSLINIVNAILVKNYIGINCTVFSARLFQR